MGRLFNAFFGQTEISKHRNGAFQSVGWPACIAIMGNWFGPENRGLIMGVWSGNPNLGNIIGYEIGTITYDHLGLGFVSFCFNFLLRKYFRTIQLCVP